MSYSRVDRPFVDELVPLLRKVYGLSNVWFDEEIQGGQDWWDEILNQIATCDIFLYLLSDTSVGSPYCRAEYTEAYRLGKAILPVLVRARTEIPSDLSRIQFVDLSASVKDTEALTGLYAAIQGLSNKLSKQDSKIRWPERTPVPSASPTKSAVIAQPEATFAFPPEMPVANKKSPSRLQEWWSRQPVEIRVAVIALFSTFVTAICGVIGTLGPPIISGLLSASTHAAPSLTPTSISPSYTPIMSASLTVQPITPLVTVIPSNTAPTKTLGPLDTSTVETMVVGFPLIIERSGDTLAICPSQAADLSALKLDFGQNEHYVLGEVFPSSATTASETCWCLKQPNPQFPLPPSCQEGNTSTLSKVGDWRNAKIKLSLDGKLLGDCNAQPTNLNLYHCDLVISEQ